MRRRSDGTTLFSIIQIASDTGNADALMSRLADRGSDLLADGEPGSATTKGEAVLRE
jgi:hypothetical protein